jgi:hypothetical protein
MSRQIALLVLSSLSSARAADYDGDHYDDLVVGVPYEDLDGLSSVGGIEVIRGGMYGLTSIGDAFIHQGTAGVSGSNQMGDHFGEVLGAGDVDADGVADLIVGGPADSDRIGVHAGSIWRLELAATRSSLAVTSSQHISQATTGVLGTAEDEDEFGKAVAVADFDGDGYDDVVVGVPHQALGALGQAGAVQYFRGGSTGLTTTGQLYIDQDTTDVESDAEVGDRYGEVLAAGDFDADGYADLAVGVSYEDWSGSNEGAVNVLYGSSSGPSATVRSDQFWSEGGGTLAAGTLDDENYCGSALAVGDFDFDGYDDLAVGCPWDDSPGEFRSGSVLVLYGSSAGLDDSEVWSQASTGVLGSPQASGDFGRALTAGHFDDDGYADLAIGAPGIDGYAGSVHVLMGARAGLSDWRNLRLSQDTRGVLGTAAHLEGFGFSLTSGDYNGDGRDDLVVGVPWDEEPAGLYGSGLIHVFYGSASGPTTSADMLFHQDSSGIADAVEDGDLFGYSLR